MRNVFKFLIPDKLLGPYNFNKVIDAIARNIFYLWSVSFQLMSFSYLSLLLLERMKHNVPYF